MKFESIVNTKIHKKYFIKLIAAHFHLTQFLLEVALFWKKEKLGLTLVKCQLLMNSTDVELLCGMQRELVESANANVQ